MRFRYDECKAAQAAAVLLELAGGSMFYLALIKLLYLADRDSLIETGFTITGDRLVSMPYGPVPSNTLNRINLGPKPNETTPWTMYVSAPSEYQVKALRRPPEVGRLSDFELDILRSVFHRYGRMNRFDLVELTHRLPEWEDPGASSAPIDYTVILRSAGKTEAEIAAMTAEAEHQYLLEQYAL
jgi:hypothetical protein